MNVLNTHLFSRLNPSSGVDYSNATISQTIFNYWISPIVANSSGVVCFFLVSGYIIADVRLYEGAFEFIVKRIFRIYPLYIFAVIVSIYLFDGCIPEWRILIPCLSLFGEFFNSTPTLNGVDWTLKLEIVFYIYMTLLYSIRHREKFTVFRNVFVILSIFVCHLLPHFALSAGGRNGDFNLFFPFLLIGVLVKSYERGEAPVSLLIAAFAINLVFMQPRNISLIIASLTYAVYLFHSWFYFWIENKMQSINQKNLISSLVGLISVFVAAYLAMILVERPGIRIGRKVALYGMKSLSILRH